MGYTTDFDGEVTIDPPLSAEEVKYINQFAETRRMNRKNGPYYLGIGDFGQDHESDIIDYNHPPEGQPGLWCQWVVSEDGTTLEWDGGEKFYDATEWMRYLIDHFLGHDPQAARDNIHFGFLQGHTLNGIIYAQGEESGDVWKIVVDGNEVMEIRGRTVYDDEI